MYSLLILPRNLTYTSPKSRNGMQHFLTTLLLLLLSQPVFSDAVELDEQEVIAKSDRLNRIASQVFNRADFAGKYSSLSDLLQNAAGLQVIGHNPGTPKDLSIRGSTHNQITFVIDGHVVNDAQFGGFDIDKIPVQQIEKIEVIQGNSSLAGSENSIGGTIKITTVSPEANQTALYSNIQSYNTKQYGLAHSFPGLGNWLISADKFSADGNYPVEVPSPFYAPNNRMNVENLKNNEFEKESYVGKFNTKPSRQADIHLKTTYSSSVKNIPNYISNSPINQSRFSQEETNYLINFNFAFNKFTRFEASYTGINKLEEYLVKTNDSTEDEEKKYEYNSTENHLSGKLSYTTPQIEGDITVILRSESYADNKKHIDDRDKCTSAVSECDVSVDQSATTYSSRLKLYNNSLTQALGVSFNQKALSHQQENRLGAKEISKDSRDYRYWVIDYENQYLQNTFIRASYAMSIRIPSLYERYGNRGLMKGNSALLPEKSRNTSIDIETQYGIGAFSSSFYYRELHDAIVPSYSNGVGIYQNSTSAEILGLQFQYTKTLGDFNIRIYLMQQESLTNSDVKSAKNKKLSGIYHHVNSLMLKYHLDHNINIHFSRTWNADLYLDTSNLVKQDDSKLLSGGLSYSNSTFNCDLTFSNILNERTLDQENRPKPGRAFILNLQYLLN